MYSNASGLNVDKRVYLLNYGRERKFQLIRNAINPTVNHDHDQMAITLVIYGCDLIPSARGAGRLRSLARVEPLSLDRKRALINLRW